MSDKRVFLLIVNEKPHMLLSGTAQRVLQFTSMDDLKRTLTNYLNSGYSIFGAYEIKKEIVWDIDLSIKSPKDDEKNKDE